MEGIELGTISYFEPQGGQSYGSITPDEDPNGEGSVQFFIADGKKLHVVDGKPKLLNVKGSYFVRVGDRIAFERKGSVRGPTAKSWGLMPKTALRGTNPHADTGGGMPNT